MTRKANILLFTYGSRGDVEPFLALATGLKQAGHDVTISTAERYGDWIRDNGFHFAPLSNDIINLGDTPDGKTALEGSSGILKRIAAGARLARISAPMNDALGYDAWNLAQEIQPDLIVYHPKVIAAPHIAQRLEIPALIAAFQPLIIPTSEFPASGMPGLPIPGYNKLSYTLVNLSYAAFRKSINRLRKDALELPSVKKNHEVLFPQGISTTRILHAISPSVVPKPEDWPKEAIMTGYWNLPSDTDYEPPESLYSFIEAGPAPIYIGFGSMTANDPKALQQIVIEAIRKADVRAILSTGWAGFDPIEAEDILSIPSVPHSWLFPKMSAVVHHGGMGTTAQGFHAGIPCVICPFFGDQPFWAKASTALGVGAPYIPRNQLTSEKLSASIRTALQDPSLRQNAQTLAEKLKTENGTATAITEIESLLPK